MECGFYVWVVVLFVVEFYVDLGEVEVLWL